MTTPAYAGWVVQLDPPAVATDRTMLDINNPDTGIMIATNQSGAGIDWGTAELTQYMSQQGQWGNAPAGTGSEPRCGAVAGGDRSSATRRPGPGAQWTCAAGDSGNRLKRAGRLPATGSSRTAAPRRSHWTSEA